MLDLPYTYETCVQNSEKVSWRLDDVMPRGTQLDFSRPFLPESLAGAERLPFLSDEEHRALNQISGNAYINLFAFVEEYILALAVQLAQAELFGDHQAIRALVRFADEEVKHQTLFYRFMDAFREGFGAPCEVLSTAASVAGVILGKSSLATLTTTLHEVLRKIDRVSLATPDDRYLFACELMTRGGVLEAVGRSIKIQAILHGAKEPPGR